MDDESGCNAGTHEAEVRSPLSASPATSPAVFSVAAYQLRKLMPKGFTAACLHPHLKSFICGNNTTSDATCHSFPADLPQLVAKSNVIKAFSKVFLNEFHIFSSSVYVFDAFFFFFDICCQVRVSFCPVCTWISRQGQGRGLLVYFQAVRVALFLTSWN